MKTITVVVCLSLIVCCILVIVIDKYLSRQRVGYGSQYLDSPNSRYEAYIHNFKTYSLFGNIKRYYEFVVYDVENKGKELTGPNSFFIYDEHRIKYVRLETVKSEIQLDMDRGSENIEWSPDSSEVTYAFDGIELKFKIEETSKDNK